MGGTPLPSVRWVHGRHAAALRALQAHPAAPSQPLWPPTLRPPACPPPRARARRRHSHDCIARFHRLLLQARGSFRPRLLGQLITQGLKVTCGGSRKEGRPPVLARWRAVSTPLAPCRGAAPSACSCTPGEGGGTHPVLPARFACLHPYAWMCARVHALLCSHAPAIEAHALMPSAAPAGCDPGAG